MAASGTIMAQHLAAAVAGGRWRAGAMDALSRLSAEQAAAVVEVYHGALMWCFGLSGAVMTLALLLAFGLPDRTLRDRIDDPAA